MFLSWSVFFKIFAGSYLTGSQNCILFRHYHFRCSYYLYILLWDKNTKYYQQTFLFQNISHFSQLNPIKSYSKLHLKRDYEYSLKMSLYAS